MRSKSTLIVKTRYIFTVTYETRYVPKMNTILHGQNCNYINNINYLAKCYTDRSFVLLFQQWMKPQEDVQINTLNVWQREY